MEQAGNIRLEKIHERIKTLKQSKIPEEGYMQLGELLKQEHDEGHRQGYKTGYKEAAGQMLELVSCLIADGKTDCIPRLKEDKDFYQEMLKEYHL